MNWTVIWKTDAEGDLATLWMRASDRDAVTVAANRIDVLLRKDPLKIGESRAEDDRIYYEPPLAVLFTVDELDCKVFVERVWRPS
jgi:hypothetical protein